MTEYEKIRNELVRLGWTESQGRGDHCKFSKEGMRDITVSKTISDDGRAYKNACANIRKVEPAFSVGKAVQGKEKEKQRQVLQRVQERLQGLTDQQKLFRQAYSFIHVGAKVRYVSPEGRDWTLLDKPDSVMNVPYIVTEMDGAYISSPDSAVCIEEEDNPGNVSVVSPLDLESWDTVECNYCHRRLPRSVSMGRETLGPMMEAVEMVKDNPLPRKAMDELFLSASDQWHICPDCLVEMQEGFAASNSDMTKGRIDTQQVDYGKALPAELAGKYSVSPEGALIFASGVSLKDMTRIVLDYGPWLVKHEMNKNEFLKRVQKCTAKPKEAKPTLYNLWNNLRVAIARIYPDVKGLDTLTYVLSKVRKISVFEVRTYNEEQQRMLSQTLPEIYDMLSRAAPENTYVRLHCVNKPEFDWIVTPVGEEDPDAHLEVLRANLPEKDFERLCRPQLLMNRIPKADCVCDAVVRTVRNMKLECFKEEPKVTFFATMRVDESFTPVAMLLVHCDDGRQVQSLRDLQDEFGFTVLDVLECEYPADIDYELNIYARNFSELDPSEVLNYEKLLTDDHLIWSGTVEDCDFDDPADDRVEKLTELLCPHWVGNVLRVQTPEVQWDRVFIEAMTVYANMTSALREAETSTGHTEQQIMKDHCIALYDTEEGLDARIIKKPDMEDMTKEMSGKAQELCGYETKELLRELKRRGVTMENVKIPVMQYEQVNMEEP